MERLSPYGITFKLDPQSGLVTEVRSGWYMLRPRQEGTYKYTDKDVREHAPIIFDELTNFKGIESLGLPSLPLDFAPRLAKLTQLKSLEVHQHVDSSLAAVANHFNKLESLNITRCPFTASDIRALVAVKSLKHLALSSDHGRRSANADHGARIDAIASLTQLESLQLHDVILQPGDLKKLGALPLKRLSLRDLKFPIEYRRQMQEPQYFSQLLEELPAFSQLEELEISHLSKPVERKAPLPVLRGLAKLQHLRKLTISHTFLHPDDIAEIGQLRELQYLSIEYPEVPGDAFEKLSGLTQLRELSYQGQIDPAGVAVISNFAELGFVRLLMPDNSLDSYQPWQRCPKLLRADLLGILPSAEACAVLDRLEDIGEGVLSTNQLEKFVNLKRLDLKSAPGPKDIAILAQLTKLEALTVGDTGPFVEIKPATIQSLTVLKSLKELGLRSPRIGKTHLAAIKSMQPLDRLTLGNNTLSDDDVHDIAALANVKLIDLRSSKLSARGVRDLLELRPDLVVLWP